jgi:hypothetical protein
LFVLVLFDDGWIEFVGVEGLPTTLVGWLEIGWQGIESNLIQKRRVYGVAALPDSL